MDPQTLFFSILAAATWLATIAVIGVYLFRNLQLKERLGAIERGADLTFDPEATANRTRRSGIVFVAAGLGISAADVIVALAAKDVGALGGRAVAIIPIAIGIGLFVDYGAAAALLLAICGRQAITRRTAPGRR